MIRATLFALVDQGMLSALSFLLAAVLVRVAGREEFGIYSQLLNLQSLFSSLHAGLFVSAYLSIGARMVPGERREYRSYMSRLEFLFGPIMAFASVLLLAAGGKLVGGQVTLALASAFGLALLGLWWREFLRQTQFADMRQDRALLVDSLYAVALCALVAALAIPGRLDTGTILLSMGAASLVATLPPLVRAARGSRKRGASERQWLRDSWSIGRWDAVGSLATWAYSQSYIYIAALHGGLAEAGEVAAARLLAAPLSLFWASYSNVLRPRASQLLGQGDSHGMAVLARRSVAFILLVSIAYAATVVALLPWINKVAFGGQMENLLALSLWWIAYTAVAGLTTIASGVMRSGLAFREILLVQVSTSVLALALLAGSTRFHSPAALVVAMLISEALSASIFWLRMARVVARHSDSR